MYVAVVPNRRSPPAILLRESYSENGKTKKRTLKNLSDWPAERIEQLRAVLRGDELVPRTDALEIVRSLPHGHVLAALGTARRIELDALLPRRAPQRRRDLALALIVGRLLDPAAKLATARMLDPATASHSLGETLGLSVTAREVYATLDWLGDEQSFIETTLARRHLKNGALLLYDITSTYLEGRCCELARYGHSRDHRRDRAQLVIGLLCAADGCPVAVEVFEGNTADPMTLSSQIDKLKQRFKLQRVVMVGDRGLLTSARIEETLRPAGLDWITALRAPAIKALAAEGGPLQPSLFDARDMAEIDSPDFPDERLPFRSIKTVDLELRPVFHWIAPRVRAHVLLCMLAYYLEWHMRQSLAPMLFDEHDPTHRNAQRTSPVAKATPSPAAQRKTARKHTDPAEGEPLPVHS